MLVLIQYGQGLSISLESLQDLRALKDRSDITESICGVKVYELEEKLTTDFCKTFFDVFKERYRFILDKINHNSVVTWARVAFNFGTEDPKELLDILSYFPPMDAFKLKTGLGKYKEPGLLLAMLKDTTVITERAQTALAQYLYNGKLELNSALESFPGSRMVMVSPENIEPKFTSTVPNVLVFLGTDSCWIPVTIKCLVRTYGRYFACCAVRDAVFITQAQKEEAMRALNANLRIKIRTVGELERAVDYEFTDGDIGLTYVFDAHEADVVSAYLDKHNPLHTKTLRKMIPRMDLTAPSVKSLSLLS